METHSMSVQTLSGMRWNVKLDDVAKRKLPSIGDTVVSLCSSYAGKKVGDVGQVSKFEPGKICVHWKRLGIKLCVSMKHWPEQISLIKPKNETDQKQGICCICL